MQARHGPGSWSPAFREQLGLNRSPTSDFRDGFALTEEFHSPVLVILHIAVLARFLDLLLTRKEQKGALQSPITPNR
ncbi:MAG: hypothetical protein OXL36_05350 [Bryobacterales bacterium]|nr:hypothetical protein [Bryobacterales bacterium]